jgi:hypothetical protein
MKLELIKDDGKTVGWNLVAETKEEKLQLGSIRALEFWGEQGRLKYNGIKSEKQPEGEYVVELGYCTEDYQKKVRDNFRTKVLTEINAKKQEDQP